MPRRSQRLSRAKKNTIASCLTTLGIEVAELSSCRNLGDEFQWIKKQYFRRILRAHPDKGGDPETFRLLNTAFEALRQLFEQHAILSFATSGLTVIDAAIEVPEVPRSWEFYSDVASESIPLYKVELARSGRSRCQKACERPKIEKLDVRIGSLDTESGKYGRWCHLWCWKIPVKIWKGLPDPKECQDKDLFRDALRSMNELLFCGFHALPLEDQTLIVEYVMDQAHWAKETKRTKQPEAKENTTPNAIVVKKRKMEKKPKAKLAAKKSKAMVVAGHQNQLVPAATSVLQGKTVVLTGIFPEIGGGAGLNLGKDRLRGILEGLGAKVRSAVSGRTDILVVGTEPGMSKVSTARSKPKCQLIGIDDLKQVMDGAKSLEAIEAPEISSYSSGYYGNGLARLEDRGYGYLT